MVKKRKDVMLMNCCFIILLLLFCGNDRNCNKGCNCEWNGRIRMNDHACVNTCDSEFNNEFGKECDNKCGCDDNSHLHYPHISRPSETCGCEISE